MERITVEVGDPPLTVGFVGRWLVEPDPDATRTGLDRVRRRAYWGVALTGAGGSRCTSRTATNAGPSHLGDYDGLGQAERDVPADIIARAAAELGEERIVWRDI
jgi:hypothetical protein